MKPTSTHVYQIGLQVTNWVTFKSWAFKMNPIWQSCKDAHNIQYGIKKWATNWKNILNISLINSKWMIIRIRKSFLIHAEWSLQHKAEIKDMLWNPDEGKSQKIYKNLWKHDHLCQTHHQGGNREATTPWKSFVPTCENYMN